MTPLTKRMARCTCVVASPQLMELPVTGVHHMLPWLEALSADLGSQPQGPPCTPKAWCTPAAGSPISWGVSQMKEFATCWCKWSLGSWDNKVWWDQITQSHNYASCHACVAWQEVRLCGSCIRSYCVFTCVSVKGLTDMKCTHFFLGGHHLNLMMLLKAKILK